MMVGTGLCGTCKWWTEDNGWFGTDVEWTGEPPQDGNEAWRAVHDEKQRTGRYKP